MGNSPRFQQSTAIGRTSRDRKSRIFGQPVLLLAGEQLLEGEEVAVGVRQVVDVNCGFGHGVPSQ